MGSSGMKWWVLAVVAVIMLEFFGTAQAHRVCTWQLVNSYGDYGWVCKEVIGPAIPAFP
jgi:hypothetical protein